MMLGVGFDVDLSRGMLTRNGLMGAQETLKQLVRNMVKRYDDLQVCCDTHNTEK